MGNKENADDDIYNYSCRLASALSLIEKSQKIHQRDKILIKGFIEHLRAKRVSAGRLAKYAFTLKILVEHLGASTEAATRKDIENLSTWIQGQGYEPHTVSDYIFAVKYYFKFARYGNTDRETPFPEEVRWLKATQKANERKEPEFFTPSEAEALIRTADRLRDKAMISICFERGMRPSELLLLNVGDVSFDSKGARIKVSHGKTGGRTLRIIASASLLSRYMETHPLRDHPEAPLWVSESTNRMNRRLGWVAWSRILKETAKRAGVNGKRIHHYLLRHGSATEAAKFLTDSELKVVYGWSMSSRMPQTYIHLSAKDVDPKLEALYGGKSIQPTMPELRPVLCARCNEANSPGQRFCGRCGSPLNAEELNRTSAEIEILKAKVERALEIVSELRK